MQKRLCKTATTSSFIARRPCPVLNDDDLVIVDCNVIERCPATRFKRMHDARYRQDKVPLGFPPGRRSLPGPIPTPPPPRRLRQSPVRSAFVR
jgi:hypothetical protein